MTFEVELKVQLESREQAEIREKCVSDGTLLGHHYQKDLYLDRANTKNGLSFTKTDEALRLRIQRELSAENPTQLELTYKGPRLSPESKSREEYNLVLAPTTEDDTPIAFFQSLGYEVVYTVEKEREDWAFGAVVVSLDKVTDLGSFVELETIVDSAVDVREREEQLWLLLDQLVGQKVDRGRAISDSYLGILIRLQSLGKL